ncbi:MAG: hypothetical protein MZV63_15715 [Marinilabiliales bacterium]|nr:hypothetical protein [Marinilabiliales bacterium]
MGSAIRWRGLGTSSAARVTIGNNQDKALIGKKKPFVDRAVLGDPGRGPDRRKHAESRGAQEWKISLGSLGPEPNVKQRRFVAELLKGKSQRQAAAGAGYNEDYGSDLMKMPAVQVELSRAMQKAGIDDLLIARKLRED